MNVNRVKIEPFSKNCDRSSFDCGNKALNGYLQRQASQDIKKNLACCYLVFSEEGEIAGFYTLFSYSIPLGDLPCELKSRLRYDPVPAALLGRLAVDLRAQKQGLGRIILADAIKKIEKSGLGVYALFVEAKNEKAKYFYEKHGFISLLEREKSLFLPLKPARRK